jgi:aminoglycoside phosphotransferase family enzyme/predicted kinase
VHPLPPELAGLRHAAAYPHATGTIELIETHISWVLLTGEYAYKIKRPVHYDFLDMRELATRELYCREELRLNRRFAPRLYVDVCPITLVRGSARIGGGGEPVEYAVRMRQFDRSACLDALLRDDAVTGAELRDFGQVLARLHSDSPAAGRRSEWGQPARVRALLLRNLAETATAGTAFGTGLAVQALQAPLEALLSRLELALLERRRTGRVRECHGDLHVRNIVRLAGRLTPFDCLDFEPAFRWIDVADEVALLRVDLVAHGRADLAQAFTTGWLRGGGDYGACRMFALYEVHRALVRAKVAALAAVDDAARAPALEREHRALVAVAGAALRPRRGAIVLLHGFSGSGKSWLAERLVAALPAVWISADVERKRLAGLLPAERSGSPAGGGIYTADMDERTYARLVACAEEVVGGGYIAVVDATFLRARDRARFQQLARGRELPLRVLSCTADAHVLHERLEARAVRGDVSEADAAVLAAQIAGAQPLQAQEGLVALELRTADPEAVERAMGMLRAFC